ncbi:Zinc finger, RING-type, partial [Thalictrum thalictroides]
ASNNRNKQFGSSQDEPMKRNKSCRNPKLEEVEEEHSTSTDRRTSSHSQDVSSLSSSRLRSRFSFIPGNFSFRLGRASSLGSSRAGYSLFSTANTRGLPVTSNPSDHSLIRDGSQSYSQHYRGISCPDSDALIRLHAETTAGLSAHPQNEEVVSNQDLVINNANTPVLVDVDNQISSNDTEIELFESRRANRRVGAREPIDRSVWFTRTLSVGRLRDRVLRRSSFTDGLFGQLQEGREMGDSNQEENERQVHGRTTRTQDSDANADTSPASSTLPQSSTSNSVYNSQDDELDTSRPREARYHDIMEHRTDFLERRRRIRSQVRALQRLGSRFENLSGHERSCILTGQHRSGRCTCRASNRARNQDDDTNARASISRIVMLAEALFEVLDEIHQQSVVLSSRPSVSSLGSIPAPKEVVDSMPVKIYAKLQKHQHEDVAQHVGWCPTQVRSVRCGIPLEHRDTKCKIFFSPCFFLFYFSSNCMKG